LELLNSNNVYTLIIGTGEDRQLGDFLTKKANRALNICGKTDLNQLIAVLASATALVSNDSGTMHIMAALQKPQVAIFGSTSTTWTGPVNNLAEVITLDFECSPCFKRVCPLGHTNCLHDISPDLVWKKLQPILA
jgi:heptosyltransferase-2